jgi:hypothetical protein
MTTCPSRQPPPRPRHPLKPLHPLPRSPQMYKRRMDEWIKITWLSQKLSLEFYTQQFSTLFPLLNKTTLSRDESRDPRHWLPCIPSPPSLIQTHLLYTHHIPFRPTTTRGQGGAPTALNLLHPEMPPPPLGTATTTHHPPICDHRWAGPRLGQASCTRGHAVTPPSDGSPNRLCSQYSSPSSLFFPPHLFYFSLIPKPEWHLKESCDLKLEWHLIISPIKKKCHPKHM